MQIADVAPPRIAEYARSSQRNQQLQKTKTNSAQIFLVFTQMPNDPSFADPEKAAEGLVCLRYNGGDVRFPPLFRAVLLLNRPAAGQLEVLMSVSWKSRSTVVLLASVASFASCNFGPSRVQQPGINAARAGSQAIEMYDKNSDGIVSGDELEHAPALKAALPRLDTNSDKGVSADEVTARVNAWKAMQTAMTSVRCHITLDGQPLAGAEVVFEPESFLGDEIKTATGTTNQFGDVAPTISKEDRPDPKLPGGVHFGLYKVHISKQANARETIPPRYNTQTTLGQEVSYDDPGVLNNNLAYALKTAG